MATTALHPAVPAYRSGLYEWITTTDHKKIGILYVVNSLLFFFIAGLLALGVRAELDHRRDHHAEADDVSRRRELVAGRFLVEDALMLRGQPRTPRLRPGEPRETGVAEGRLERFLGREVGDGGFECRGFVVTALRSLRRVLGEERPSLEPELRQLGGLGALLLVGR